MRTSRRVGRALCVAALLSFVGCGSPPCPSSGAAVAQASSSPSNTAEPTATVVANPAPIEPMTELDAWAAVPRMIPGVNIGNTLENTTAWETGWGNPTITEEYVRALAALGFKTIRLPVAWDTYAVDGQVQAEKIRRVGEVVDWITRAGMFCVINIHWDGGWIDSSNKEKFTKTNVFTPEAEKKFRSYWHQVSSYFAGKNEMVIFESLNEETNFDAEGFPGKAYATLTRVNQLFIDTVRKTGGNNAKRLLVVTGYNTDITKTSSPFFELPKDTIPHRLFISVHYYTPWTFVGLTEDASWGKMALTWGNPNELAELNKLFDMQRDFSTKNDIPSFIGEFSCTEKKESASRVRWLTSVWEAARSRKMVPVLWDTGHGISRNPPHKPSPDLEQVLRQVATPAERASN